MEKEKCQLLCDAFSVFLLNVKLIGICQDCSTAYKMQFILSVYLQVQNSSPLNGRPTGAVEFTYFA